MSSDYAKYLRASNGDGPAATAFLSDDRGIGDMSVITDNVLNWPSYFVATVGDLLPGDTVDVTSIFLGHLEGSIVMIDEFAPGYLDEGFSEGQVIFIKPASAWADIVADLLEGGAVPPGGTTGQALVKKSDADGDVEWGSGGGVSIISKETPGGTADGTNKVFTTALPYVGGSLQVYVNGLAQSHFVTETNPGNKTFTLGAAPASGDNLAVSYHYATSETGNADTLDGYHLTGLLQAIFPVGSKYDSGESPTLPPLIASIGTWERFKGRVVVGVDEAQAEFDTVGEQGGAKTHTLTVQQMPSHTHDLFLEGGPLPSANGRLKFTSPAAGQRYTSMDSAGGNQPHNNLQPYETTYMWKRIA